MADYDDVLQRVFFAGVSVLVLSLDPGDPSSWEQDTRDVTGLEQQPSTRRNDSMHRKLSASAQSGLFGVREYI